MPVRILSVISLFYGGNSFLPNGKDVPEKSLTLRLSL